MTPTVQVSERDMNRLDKVLRRVIEATTKATPDLLTQAFVFAVQSATRATKPEGSGTIRGMPKKYKTRPVEDMPQKSGVYWYYCIPKATGKPTYFKSQYSISPTANLVPMTRGIKWWNKKQAGWDYFPTIQKGKWAQGKIGGIPYYGTAKAGFLHMLGKLGRPVDTGNLRSSLASLSKRLTGLEQGIAGTNNVRYAPTTSPDAARIGLENAATRLEHTYRKALESIIVLPGAEAW